jgi:hypothetical protein
MLPLTPKDRADYLASHPEQPPHPSDHRWPRAVRLLFILGVLAACIVLVAVGASALVDAIWAGVGAS